jgi:NAD-dependent SIR2 family protein deacetylase
LSVEGGIQGNQQKLTCPTCHKVFTAWRPDTAPGAKVKCYFCKTEVEDEAAKRPPAAPAAPVQPATPPTTTS